MSAKINNVTNTDIDVLIRSGQDLCTYAVPYAERIGKGQCEVFENPMRKAAALLTASKALTELARCILARSYA